ncbi:unnamed protein product, partial [Ectocarpus sp. 8 AP-2014]
PLFTRHKLRHPRKGRANIACPLLRLRSTNDTMKQTMPRGETSKPFSLVSPVLLKHASVPHVLGARIYLDFSLHLAHVYNLVKRRKKQKQRGAYLPVCATWSRHKKRKNINQSVGCTPPSLSTTAHTPKRDTQPTKWRCGTTVLLVVAGADRKKGTATHSWVEKSSPGSEH